MKSGSTVVGSCLLALLTLSPGAVAGAAGSDAVASMPASRVHAPLAGGYRFVIKHRAGAAERVDARSFNQRLDSAVQRAAGAGASTAPVVRAALLQRMAAPGWSVVKTNRTLDAAEAMAFVRELKADPSVEYAGLDRMFRRASMVSSSFVPNDPYTKLYQWNFHDERTGVRAAQAWEIAQGEGVVVAVIDTGIARNNPDLQRNVIAGYDMITDRRISRRDDDGRVAGGWDLGDWYEQDYCTGWATPDPHWAGSSSWHGSHVAGTIAQETNNALGVAGLAYKAKVMPVRVLGSCGGFESDVADAIVWAAGGQVPGLPLNAQPAEIINMSLGSGEPSVCPLAWQQAIDLANSKGAVVVVAAGNNNAVAGDYAPSSCNGVISVAATGQGGTRASYSNHGSRVDLSAPGGDGAGMINGFIRQMVNSGSTVPVDGWTLRPAAGTSMAAPHVAAVAAMVQSVVAEPLNWRQMGGLLRRTVTPFPATIPATETIGAGIVNAAAAVRLAQTFPCAAGTGSCTVSASLLSNKVAESGVAGSVGEERLYRFEASEGQLLNIMTYGGTGDISLYASYGQIPTPALAEARSTRVGNSETIRFSAPSAGSYYIKLVGERAFEGVSVVVRQ